MKIRRLSRYTVAKQISQASIPVRVEAQSYQLLKLLYPQIVGSAAQVASGIATQSSIQTAVNLAATDTTVLILPGTYTENVTISNGITLLAYGRSVVLTGNISFASTCFYANVSAFRLVGNISFAASSKGNFFRCWQSSAGTFADLGIDNEYSIIQES